MSGPCEELSADVVAVGASFAGLSFGRVGAINGLDVLVVERARRVGRVVRTTGVFAEELVEEMIVPTRFLTNRVNTVHAYSPSLRRLSFHGPTDRVFMTDTAGFLRWFASQAEEAGARMLTGTDFVGYEKQGSSLLVRVRRDGREEVIRARVLVGADGARSRVARAANLDQNTAFLMGHERLFSGISVEPKAFHLFFDRDIAPGYLAWVAPAGEHVAIGAAGHRLVHKSARAMEGHLRRVGTIFDLSEAREVRRKAGIIPVNGPLRRTHSDHCLLLGDAAGLCGNLGLDGIFPALVTGAIAGRWVAQHLLGGRPGALSAYQSEWRSHDRLGRWLRYQSILRRLYDRIGTNEAIERALGSAATPLGARLCEEILFGTFLPVAGPRMVRVFSSVMLPGVLASAAKEVWRGLSRSPSNPQGGAT